MQRCRVFFLNKIRFGIIFSVKNCKLATMKHKIIYLLPLLWLGSFLSLSAQENDPDVGKISFITFSDTTNKVKTFFNKGGEWMVLTTNNELFYYGFINEQFGSLDDAVWHYSIPQDSKNEGFNLYTDRDYVYLVSDSEVEVILKSEGSSAYTLRYDNVSSKPYFDGKFFYFMGVYKGDYGQICVEAKKRPKHKWFYKSIKQFNAPIYTERFIITRDSFNFPITLDYAKGTEALPQKYEGRCPFPSWVDMFNVYGNDPSDSFFYDGNYVYAVNFPLGFIRKYEPNEYPASLLSVDMNKFTRRSSFKYARHSTGHLLYNNQGFQNVSNEEIDSLRKTLRPGPMGAPMPAIPYSNPQYYKVKSTTKMGEFKDFGRANFLGLLGYQFLVFEDGGQLIGVSPVNGRTYNFPDLKYPFLQYTLIGDVVYYTSPNYDVMFRSKIGRIFTDEEKELLKPPPEYYERLKQMQEEQAKQMEDGN